MPTLPKLARHDWTAEQLALKADASDLELHDVSRFGAKGDGTTDDTTAIQSALDAGGIVTIGKPGTYLVGALYVGSNTTLTVGDGVTLLLKTGTSNFMLRNKGDIASPKYRDKNITISGGKFNFNSQGNPQTGAYLDGLFSGHGILMHGVDGLRIENIVEAGNALKYAFLLADVTNVICENGYIDNNSDGIHFQPPCNNIVVRNWSGWTNDNFIAFTGGDYRTHTVSENGSGDNILIENIYLNDATRNCKEPVRFVGAGQDGLGYFDNIVIRNVVAKSDPANPVIAFLYADQSVPNDYLKNTRIKKARVSGIKRLNASDSPLVANAADMDCLEIDNIQLRIDVAPQILLTTSLIRNLLVTNVHSRQTAQTTMAVPIFQLGIPGSSTGIVKIMTLAHCNFDLNDTADFSLIKMQLNALQVLNIDDAIIKFPNKKGYLLNLDGNTTLATTVNINNSQLVYPKSLIKTLTTISFSNCDVQLDSAVSYMSLADLASLGKLRVLASSSQFLFGVTNLNAPATMSYNGLSATCRNAKETLTPVQGDVANIWNSSTGGELLHYYNTWKKISTV